MFNCSPCCLECSHLNLKSLRVTRQMTLFHQGFGWGRNYVQGEQWIENDALWDTRHNRGPVRFNTINYYLLLPEAQKNIYPFQYLSTYTITKQFALKKFVMRGVKSFFKVQNESVNLTLFIQYFCPIIYYCNQLSFTTMPMPYPEYMLFVR